MSSSGKYIFAFPSVNIALKAQNVLREAGFEASVSRTPKSLASGCGYSVITDALPEDAADAFEKSGIRTRAVGKA